MFSKNTNPEDRLPEKETLQTRIYIKSYNLDFFDYWDNIVKLPGRVDKHPFTWLYTPKNQYFVLL